MKKQFKNLKRFLKILKENPFMDEVIFEAEVAGFVAMSIEDQNAYINYAEAWKECDWNVYVLQVNYPGLVGRIGRMVEKYQQPTEEEHFSVTTEITIFVS